MWLAAFWDVSTGTFFAGQDWANAPASDGTTESCWEAPVQREAEICLRGLRNMYSYYTSLLARSPESRTSFPWGEMFHLRMAVMTEWCNRVAGGRMPHGALLAHTRLTGQEVRQVDGYSEPGPDVDWQQHGREGTAAVRAILLASNFYPQPVESVQGRAPPAVPARAERNRATKEQGFPSTHWQSVPLIRGVKLWLDDEDIQRDYTWTVVRGGPAARDVQCPVPSGELLPGEYNVTFYQQAKGQWFWAMYVDESSAQLTVKWVRGRCEPGGKRWQHKNNNKHNHKTKNNNQQQQQQQPQEQQP